MKATCYERIHLLLSYSAAVKQYSKLIGQLHDLVGSVPLVEFEYLRKGAQEAFKAAEAARAALQHHTLIHACKNGAPPRV